MGGAGVHLTKSPICRKAKVFARVVAPFLHRAADDAAAVVSHRAAFDFAPEDGPAHEGAGVAAGIADQHPAGGFLANAESGDMGLGLGAVDQGEIAEIAAAADVDVERDRLAMHDPLKRDQLRPGEEMLVGGGGGAQLLGHFRVARAGLVADAGDHAARGLLAQAADQLFAKGAQRAHVHQHHPLVVQPDAALFRREAEAIGEVVNFGNANGATGGAFGHGAARPVGTDFSTGRFKRLARILAVLPSFCRRRSTQSSAIMARRASLVFPQGRAETATDLVTGRCVGLSRRGSRDDRTPWSGDRQFVGRIRPFSQRLLPKHCCRQKHRAGRPADGALVSHRIEIPLPGLDCFFVLTQRLPLLFRNQPASGRSR